MAIRFRWFNCFFDKGGHKLAAKVCIKSGENDLLRIIPFPVGEEYDFKISFVKNDYKLRMHPVGVDYFNMPSEEFQLKDWEITYHSSTQENPTKFHLKSMDSPVKYYDLPMKNYIDPIKSSEFPIPLLKIGIVDSSKFKKYKHKLAYTEIDLKQANIIEIYLIPSDFNYDKFISRWGLFDLIYTIAPMEYFVNGRYKGFLNAKYKTLYDDNSYFRQQIKINKDLSLFCNFYRDDALDGVKQDSFVSIYENGDYLKYLSLAPINYYFKNGEKSKISPAYIRQLDSNKDKMSIEEIKYWKSLFEKYKEEFKDYSLNGFSLQGD
jgi:hypothetical protein